ncbi:MAG: hypothetical protein IJ679_01060, partial [Lachnospiraceae bacterium]|nr:hypothetical protein [Lachnospiraceae bacterium]
EELDAEEPEEIEVEEEIAEDDASSEEDFEETEAEEVEESDEDLADAEEAAADEAEEVAETTENSTVEDEAGNGSDISEDQPISDAIIQDEAVEGAADTLNEDSEEEEVEATEEVAEDEASTLNASDAVGPVVNILGQDQKVYGAKVSDLQSSDTTLTNGAFSGTLKWYQPTSNTELSTYWGEGYFLAVKFTGIEGITAKGGSITNVGVFPNVDNVRPDVVPVTEGETGAFKVTNPEEQYLKVEWKTSDSSTGTHVDSYSLEGLSLGPVSDGETIVLVSSAGEVDTTNQVSDGVAGAYGKAVSELQTGVKVHAVEVSGNRWIEGTLNYVKDYTKAFGDEDNKDGYFLALDATVGSDTSTKNSNLIGIGLYSKNNNYNDKKDMYKISWGDEAPFVFRIQDTENMKLRVVHRSKVATGSQAKDRIGGTKAELTAANIDYERFYDLSELVLKESTSSSTSVTGMTIDTFQRAEGENGLLHGGDTVNFEVGGTITGGKLSAPTVKITSINDASNPAKVVTPSGGWTVTSISVNGMRWTGKVAMQLAENASGDVAFTPTAATYGGTSMDTVSPAACSLEVLAKTMGGTLSLAGWKHNDQDYVETTNPYGVGEAANSKTYVQATQTQFATENIVAFKWTIKKSDETFVPYYTYAEKNTNYASNFNLPTFETEGTAKVTVQTMGYYTPDGSLPSGVDADTPYTEDLLDAGKNSTTLVPVQTTWNTGTTDSSGKTVKDYSKLGTLTVIKDSASSDLTGHTTTGSSAHMAGGTSLAYTETAGGNGGTAYEVNVFGVNENEVEGTFIRAKYVKDSGYTYDNFQILAYEWNLEDAAGNAYGPYYTYSTDSTNNYGTKLVLPSIKKAGNLAVSIKVKRYKNTGGTTLPSSIVSAT